MNKRDQPQMDALVENTVGKGALHCACAMLPQHAAQPPSCASTDMFPSPLPTSRQRLHLHDGVIQHDAAIEQITSEIQNDCRDGVAALVETMWSTSVASGSAQCSRSSGFASVPVECECAAQYQSKKDNVSLHTQSEVVERVGRSYIECSRSE